MYSDGDTKAVSSCVQHKEQRLTYAALWSGVENAIHREGC